jgi:uncharacterized membrane protein YGL010W
MVIQLTPPPRKVHQIGNHKTKTMSGVPKEAGLSFNLLDQLVFYGSYHNNPWNQLIHFFFVPCIWMSAGVWLCYTGELLPNPLASILPGDLGQYFVINGAFVGFAGYSLYYLTLTPFVGVTFENCSICLTFYS